MKGKEKILPLGVAAPKKRGWATLLALLLIFTAVISYLYLGIAMQHTREIHWSPTYAQEDISALLYKAERTDEDYKKIYEQTGLTKLGVEGLIEQRM